MYTCTVTIVQYNIMYIYTEDQIKPVCSMYSEYSGSAFLEWSVQTSAVVMMSAFQALEIYASELSMTKSCDSCFFDLDQ